MEEEELGKAALKTDLATSNQRSGMTVGRVVRVSPRSVRASMERNRYMGWRRAGSVPMTARMLAFPTMEMA